MAPRRVGKIVRPEDARAVMGASRAYRELLARTPVDYYDTLPGSEAELLERIGAAEIVINIRSSTRFTENVFAECPRLKLLSLWGTGTDNIDLAAARRHSVTVTNTPAVSSISISPHSLTLILPPAPT